jgi:hypothetical protein
MRFRHDMISSALVSFAIAPLSRELSGPDSPWIPLPEAAFSALRSSGSSYVGNDVSIDLAHYVSLASPVVFRILHNAQRVYPQVAEAE